jgi:methionyl-tRNA formyltransferase
MGTPSFAVPSLEALAKGGHEIVLVVTRPDAPKGRGLELTKSPVKSKALELRIPVTDANNMKDPAFVSLLNEIKPDIFAVVAFRILPKEILAIPPLGSYNVHPSLLPLYRGAAPIQWAIANGETETGVSIFRLGSIIDGGDIVRQEKFTIDKTETAGELSIRLSLEGARMLSSAITDIGNGKTVAVIQNSALATPAPKLEKEDGLIDFTMDADRICNRIRGFSPFPGSFTIVGGKRIVVLSASKVMVSGKAGTVLDVNSGGILVAAGTDAVLVEKLKPEGRSAMTARDYANGNRIQKGFLLGV